MPEKLAHNSYGKSDVRVTKVIRRGRGRSTRHELIELSVEVTLVGDFEATYLTGDNAQIVATDSMKNTVYVLAKKHALDSIESFALDLVGHFIDTYPQVTTAYVTVRQHGWQRIEVNGRPHPHAFVSGGNELRVCNASGLRESRDVVSGLQDLLVLKTTGSAFEGFVRDEYTTLKDTDDRIFATAVAARWTYTGANVDYNKAFAAVRAALVETFASHESLSVQQTLYAMGRAALKKSKAVREISITMPNKHRILVNLEPFGLSNDNEIFVWTDAPYGNIHGTISRS